MNDEIMNLFDAGERGAHIAERMGISRQRVHQIIQKELGQEHANFKDGGLILERANFRCEKCGEREFLQIHHKDKNRTNGSTENAQVLCNKCHKKEHRGDKRMNKSMDTKERKPPMTASEMASKKEPTGTRTFG